MKYVLFALTMVICSACSHIQEGEIDYVKTIDKQSNEQDCQPTVVSQSSPKPCYEKLFRKYEKTEAIGPGETVSIHLSSAFLKSSPEGRNYKELLTGRSANAEIAIVVYACEQGINGCDTSFGPAKENKGRLVFFTNGAKAKQYLNFSYLPVYGPIAYQGKPIIFQISIMELDISGTQERKLVDTLANIGAKAYPPASNVFSVLNTLGKTFLAGNQHDVIFRYSGVLMPQGGNGTAAHPKLSVGNYIFLRKNTVAGEQEADPWKNVVIDANTGRLVKHCSPSESNLACKQVDNRNSKGQSEQGEKANGFMDYRDNTYLNLQVQSGFTAASLDNQQTLASLIQDLEKSQDKAYLNVKEILDSTNIQLQQRSAYTKLGSPLGKLQNQVKQSDKQDTKDEQAVAAGQFIDNLNISLKAFDNKQCKTITAANKSACHQLPTMQQLQNLIIETRSILIKKDPIFDLTKIPLDPYSAAQKVANNAAVIKAALHKIK